MALAADLRRALRLAGALALSALVYWANVRTPPEFRLGILYVIPVLLVAWHDGLAWGSGFAAATALLRFVIGIDQMPADTHLIARFVNELCYHAVVVLLFSQAEDGIRDLIVTGVQTCALPI